MSNLTTTSDEILASARTLIMTGGYNGFSYADIATVVEIRKASIHHHFPTKVDLVRTLVERYYESAQSALEALERNIQDPVELLKSYTGYWAQCIEDSSRPFCICALLASELPALPPEVATGVRAYFRLLSGWVTSVMERGQKQASLVFDRSPQVEAEMFIATVHGAMLSARAYGTPSIFAAILEPTLARLQPAKG